LYYFLGLMDSFVFVSDDTLQVKCMFGILIKI